MGKRFLLVLGWSWPFVVAVAGIAAIAVGYPLRSDGEFVFLLLVASLGAPAVGYVVSGWLPAGWPSELRQGVAVVLTPPIVAAELFLMVCLLAYGANLAGPGWIE